MASDTAEKEEVYDYSAMYRKDGLIFEWDASKFRPDIDVTSLVNKIDRDKSLNVAGKTATGKDAANGDYTLKEDSILFDEIDGFFAPPYEKMGLTE